MISSSLPVADNLIDEDDEIIDYGRCLFCTNKNIFRYLKLENALATSALYE